MTDTGCKRFLLLHPWIIYLGVEVPFEAARASGSDSWLVLIGLWLFFGLMMLVSPLLHFAFIIQAILLGFGMLRWIQRRPVVCRLRCYWWSREGLPYQTLMASVLHKYVTGQLQEKPAS